VKGVPGMPVSATREVSGKEAKGEVTCRSLSEDHPLGSKRDLSSSSSTFAEAAPAPKKRKKSRSNNDMGECTQPHSSAPIPQSSSPTTPCRSQINHSSQSLAHQWSSLRLGTQLGSAAYKEFIQRFSSPQTKIDLNANQILQMVRTMQTRTLLPPRDSFLHQVVKKQPSPSTTNDVAVAHKLPTSTLSNLYEFMCRQDADDESSSRRQMHYLSASSCLQTLQSFENKACQLKLREDRLKKQWKHITSSLDPEAYGLEDDISMFLGVTPSSHDE